MSTSTTSLPNNPTYEELVASVQSILANLAGFSDLAKRNQSVGDLIGRLDELCKSNNQLLLAVASLQADVHKLKNCQDGPIIVSVAAA